MYEAIIRRIDPSVTEAEAEAEARGIRGLNAAEVLDARPSAVVYVPRRDRACASSASGEAPGFLALCAGGGS